MAVILFISSLMTMFAPSVDLTKVAFPNSPPQGVALERMGYLTSASGVMCLFLTGLGVFAIRSGLQLKYALYAYMAAFLGWSFVAASLIVNHELLGTDKGMSIFIFILAKLCFLVAWLTSFHTQPDSESRSEGLHPVVRAFFICFVAVFMAFNVAGVYFQELSYDLLFNDEGLSFSASEKAQMLQVLWMHRLFLVLVGSSGLYGLYSIHRRLIIWHVLFCVAIMSYLSYGINNYESIAMKVDMLPVALVLMIGLIILGVVALFRLPSSSVYTDLERSS